MIIPEAPAASGAPRNAHAGSSRKRPMVVVSTLLLAATFVLAGASTATAAPAFTNNHMTSASDPCSGQKPGTCPD